MTVDEQLKDISEIKNLMEKSSKFISLSGLSGVFAGIFALIGASAVYLKYIAEFNSRFSGAENFTQIENVHEFLSFTLFVGIIILVLTIISGLFFTIKKAKKNNNLAWDNTSKRLIVNLFIPIVTGAFFIMVLTYHHIYYLIAPSTLIFYGLGLINASKFTLHDVKYLGALEVLLGILSAFFIGYGLLFWAIGFGVLHIIYGVSMYMKYDR